MLFIYLWCQFSICAYFISIQAIVLCERTENCLKDILRDFHIKNILPYLISVLWYAECVTLNILHFEAKTFPGMLSSHKNMSRVSGLERIKASDFLQCSTWNAMS